MAMPIPLTRSIADLSLDTMALAQRIEPTELREQIIANLRQINTDTDRLHLLRLLSRNLEDTGRLSERQQRRVRELEEQMNKLGELERLEYRPLPMGTAYTEMPGQ